MVVLYMRYTMNHPILFKVKSIFLFFLLIHNIVCSGQIQVDSIRTQISNCPNDGHIRVYAKSPNLPVLYSITAGPVTQPIQTGNNFLSLPSGNYTIRISDGVGNSTFRTVTVPGNYQPLEFNALTTDPMCAGESNGKIIGNQVFNTGYGPFTWQLIAPSPVLSAPQANDTFPNLPAGNYTVRITDACGSYRTKVVSLNDPGTIQLAFYGLPQIEIIGCDSALVTFFMKTDAFRFPNTYTFETNNGTYSTTTPTKVDLSNGSIYFMVQQLISNFSYGNYLKVTVTNACGNSATTGYNYARTFSFCPSYSNDFKNCVYNTTVHYNINAFGCVNNNTMYTHAAAPIFYSFTDISTNTIIDSATLHRKPGINWYEGISGISIQPTVPPNKNYRLFVRDACGRTFTQNYYITAPVTYPPKIISKSLNPESCLDSTTMLAIRTQYFKTIPVLVMLSGPSGPHSTKPDYQYTDTYTYPDTLQYTSYSPGNSIYNFTLKNMTYGKYVFKVIDSCGTEIRDSITITPAQVTDLSHTIKVKKGCLGRNQIHYSFDTGSGFVNIHNISTGINYHKFYSSSTSVIIDSILNIPSGTYIVELNYLTIPDGVDFNNGNFCTTIRDSIVIRGYEIPFVYSSNSILCQNNLNLEIVPDSSKGVPPYQFEVLSGPMIFPIQNSPVFSVNTAGTYTVRIYDVCGNASTRQVTVDTISTPFLTSNFNGICSKARFTYPYSLYYQYSIVKPDQTIFTGDSLIIDPITPADTGTYLITRITDIGGCKDTSSRSYRVTMKPESKTMYRICEGDTLFLGTKFYTLPGIYRDTLVAQGGCDSLVTITLNISPAPEADLENDTALCQGQSLTLRANSGYKAYYWNGDLSDSTRQSIVVNSVGTFWLLVRNNDGCTATDTMKITALHPTPAVQATQDMTICQGETIQLYASGGDYYTWSTGQSNSSTITVSPNMNTTYTVIAHTLEGCRSGQEDITISVLPTPTTPLFSKGSQVHCFDDEPYRLHTDWGNHFLWLPSGDTTESILVYEPGIYSVKVSNEHGCSISGEVTITEYCPGKLFVPLAFSPNGDGNNDELEIFGRHIGDFEIKIFNRWGEIIFISNERTHQWDGKFRGEDMPVGTYPWIIHYKNEFDQTENTLKGSITIVR
jgi:gliding motility-associated-like protein